MMRRPTKVISRKTDSVRIIKITGRLDPGDGPDQLFEMVQRFVEEDEISFLLDLRLGRNDEVRRELLDARLERFIGVIYRPDTERLSHYSAAQLPRQFDAYVWFDETNAVTPLPTEPQPGEEETYPFGL